MDQATVFSDDPAAQAASFEAQGFEWLHVVDLDGAFAGKPMNADAVEAILKRITIPVQLGGGIRDMKTVEGWLAKGVSRVIIGTAAVRDPAFVREAARLHPGKIAVGIDAKDGLVAVEGWAQTSTLTAEELGRRFEDAGVCRHHLHRHRPRRRAEGPQHSDDAGARPRRHDPGHRLGRPRVHGRYRAPDRTRLRHPRRRDLRPRAL